MVRIFSFLKMIGDPSNCFESLKIGFVGSFKSLGDWAFFKQADATGCSLSIHQLIPGVTYFPMYFRRIIFIVFENLFKSFDMYTQLAIKPLFSSNISSVSFLISPLGRNQVEYACNQSQLSTNSQTFKTCGSTNQNFLYMHVMICYIPTIHLGILYILTCNENVTSKYNFLTFST